MTKFVHTKEQREKMSRKKRGKKNPMWGKKGPRCPSFGLKRSPETRKKMSESKKGPKNYLYGAAPEDTPRYDKTIYRFHRQDGEYFVGTQYEFRTKYDLCPTGVCFLVNEKQKTHRKWRLIGDGKNKNKKV